MDDVVLRGVVADEAALASGQLEARRSPHHTDAGGVADRGANKASESQHGREVEGGGVVRRAGRR